MFVIKKIKSKKKKKNISPMGIKVSLSIIDNNGQNLSVELNHGDFILVNDSGIETKSIIIQRRKGNIEVLENIKISHPAFPEYADVEGHFKEKIKKIVNLEIHNINYKKEKILKLKGKPLNNFILKLAVKKIKIFWQ